MKLLVVYNTYGQASHQIPFYVDSLRSILWQSTFADNEFKVVISACCPSNMWQIQSTNTFGDALSYSFIGDNVPLSVSFNHSVDKMISHFGEFDDFLYLDSGITLWDPLQRFDAMATLYAIHKNGNHAITAAMPSNDDGRQWWGIEYGEEDFVFPVGKCTNMHAQIFSKDWKTAYNRVLPDVFASHCMESAFSGMAAAIHRKYVLTPRVHLLHAHSMDGASLGSRQPDSDRRPMSTMFETGGLFFKTKRTVDDMYRDGVELGFGIEECKEPWKHRPECFDENGFAKDPRLKDFYRDNLYLKKEEFDYDLMNCQFIPGK